MTDSATSEPVTFGSKFFKSVTSLPLTGTTGGEIYTHATLVRAHAYLSAQQLLHVDARKEGVRDNLVDALLVADARILVLRQQLHRQGGQLARSRKHLPS